MSLEKFNAFCEDKLNELKIRGVQKGQEKIIRKVVVPDWVKDGRLPNTSEDKKFGPRVFLEGHERDYLLMNSNSYLGLSFHPALISSEETGVQNFGTGPGAVRFISGTYAPHVDLENRLARFHEREAAMIFSAAYAAVMGVLPALIHEATLVVSDELNHNCIINAIRLSRPARKEIYNHLAMDDLDRILNSYASDKIYDGNKIEGEAKIKRVLVVTDGIFSMRGDHAPIDKIIGICRKYEERFEEGIITVADDSHGVGSFGKTGRGCEEFTGSKVDILVATLGKALGINGGYVTASRPVIDYLRETSPFYIYSNPVSPSEAITALKSLEILDSDEGQARLEKIRALKVRFENGLKDLGFETIPGGHPVTPLLVCDTQKTARLVEHLFQYGVLATGLNFPVVPRGSEEIRFQINANHTYRDIEFLLEVLKKF